MHVLGDGYTWSMQTVSSARDVHNRDRVIQSVILFFFFFSSSSGGREKMKL